MTRHGESLFEVCLPGSGVLWAEPGLLAPPLLLQLPGQNLLLLQQVLLLPLQPVQIPQDALTQTLHRTGTGSEPGSD